MPGTLLAAAWERGTIVTSMLQRRKSRLSRKGRGAQTCGALKPSYILGAQPGGLAFGVPHPHAGRLLLGPAGARAAAVLLDLWGQGLHGASTYGLVTSCLQGPLRVQPSCRSLAGGPRSLWDGGQVTLAR